MLYEDYEAYLYKYRAEYGEQTIVLMQCGSFYELYDDGSKQTDLKTLGELLNIQVSRRNKAIVEVSRSNLEMAGFPAYTLNKFISVLVENNYTVIIVSQVTPPPNPKRQVTDIISPGVYVTDDTGFTSASTSETTYLMSIFIEEYVTSSKLLGHFTIGASLVDLSTGKTFVFESTSRAQDYIYPMDELYRLIVSFNPREVTICANLSTSEIKTFSFDNVASYLDLQNKCVHNDYSKYCTQLSKVTYQEEILRKVYPKTGMLSCIEYVGLERHPCALVSFVRLLQFAYNHNEHIIMKIQVPTILDESKTLILSYNSLKQLDILSSNSDSGFNRRFKGPQSLCDILNRCKTAVGRRFFKERLVFPSTCVGDLIKSYDMIEKILTNSLGLVQELQKYLSSIYDVERLFRKIDLGTINPNELGNLHASLTALTQAIDILDEQMMSDVTEPITTIVSALESMLNIEELTKYNIDNIGPEVFLTGKHSDVDTLSSELNTTLAILNDLCSSLNKRASDTLFKLEKNDRDGYYLAITNKRFRDFVKEHKGSAITVKSLCSVDGEYKFFITDLVSKPVSTSSSNLKVSHPDFSSLNDKIESLSNKLKKVVLAKYKGFVQDLGTITSSVAPRICRVLAEIDFYWCCAYNAENMCYKRPVISVNENVEMSDKSFLNIKGLRHPIIETIAKDTKYIGNNISLGVDNLDGVLLYGLNSSGKSSLMKSIGIAIVMAQAGMYVACDSMTFYPYHYIFTRILSCDDIYKGQSTFTKEIAELRGILSRANSKSLVLGDELCSGTESNSALSIVATGVYHLAKRQVSCVFATHLHQLIEIDEVKNTNNVKAFHLSVEYDLKTKRLVYDRTLKPGNGSTMYGLEVCKSLDMDPDFLEMANRIRQKITNVQRNIVPCHNNKSRYNKNIYVNACGVCGAQATEVHHILQQKDADEKGFVGHVHKNDKHNLVALCEECHDNIHKGALHVRGYVQTSDGVILDWYREDVDIVASTDAQGFLESLLKENAGIKRKDIIVAMKSRFAGFTTYKVDKLIKKVQNMS